MLKKLITRMIVVAFAVSMGLGVMVGPTGIGSAEAAYPEKPIKWIVMWRPGGGADTFTRIFTKYMEKELGQKIVVQNITGGAGAIGFTAAKATKPDGYTLVTMLSGLVKYGIMKSADLNLEDFDIIASIVQSSAIVVVKSDSPFKTIKDVVEAARTKPGKVTVAVSDIGGYHHMPIAVLEREAGVQFRSITHPSTPKITAAILGGHVDVGVSTLKPTLPYLKNGEIRILASFGSSRLPSHPDLPTVAESGYNAVWGGFNGIAGPKGMPEEVKSTLLAATKLVWKNKAFLAEMEKLGYIILTEDGKTYEARLRSMESTMRKIYVQLGLAK